MNEAFTIWKKIFTSPASGFSRITINTRIWVPIIIIIILCIAAAIPLLPVQAGEAYHSAWVRLSDNYYETIGPQAKELMLALFKKPTAFSVLFFSIAAINDQIFRIALAVLSSALPLFIIGLFFKQRILIKHYITIFIFIAVIFAVEAFVKNSIILFSDYAGVLKEAASAQDLQMETIAKTSIAAFFEPKSMGRLTHLTLDYFTDIFRLVFLAFVFFAIRGTWKIEIQPAFTALIVYAMFGYLGVLIPVLMGW